MANARDRQRSLNQPGWADMGTFIAAKRVELGLRQRDLAKLIGYAQSIVGRLEQGGRASRDVIAKLATALKEQPTTLLNFVPTGETLREGISEEARKGMRKAQQGVVHSATGKRGTPRSAKARVIHERKGKKKKEQAAEQAPKVAKREAELMLAPKQARLSSRAVVGRLLCDERITTTEAVALLEAMKE